MGGVPHVTTFLLWATTIRKQRFVLGLLMLLLARPTYVYYDFRGTGLMAAMCVAGGVVGIGTALLYPRADHADSRDTFLGFTISLVFLARFVVFVTAEGNPWLFVVGRQTAPIVHLMFVYIGLLLAARPFRHRLEQEGRHGSADR